MDLVVPSLAREVRCLCVALLCALFGLVTEAEAMSNPFFTGTQISSNDLAPFTKWSGALSRYEEQKAHAEDYCTDSHCNVHQWEALLVTLKGKPVREQMDAVNRFFNAMPYVEDYANWGVDDYWETPYELMTRGGDCEDYAIAKYISLKRLGVPESAMRILIVHDSNLGGEMHALLEVKLGGKPYILDNQAKSIAAENSIFHYRPIYAINEMAWWAYN